MVPVTPVDTSEDSQLTNNRVEPVNDAIGISNDESITNSPLLSETNTQDTTVIYLLQVVTWNR